MTEKWCSHCQKLLPVSAFGKNKRTGDGLAYICKEGFRLRRQADRENISRYHRERSRKAPPLEFTPATTLETVRILNQVVVQPDGCWVWNGRPNNAGYGMVHFAHRKRPVHLVVLHLVGRYEPGKETHHICKNRLCVNPDHLVMKTKIEHRALHREGT